MSWAKVDDRLYSHPKWLRTPPAARGLWVSAMSWSMDQQTDGRVPLEALRVLGGRRADAEALVASGLWETAGEGWQFHDWADAQPGSDQLREARAAQGARRQGAAERTNHARWHVGRAVVDPGCRLCVDSDTTLGLTDLRTVATDSVARSVPTPRPSRSDDRYRVGSESPPTPTPTTTSDSPCVSVLPP